MKRWWMLMGLSLTVGACAPEVIIPPDEEVEAHDREPGSPGDDSGDDSGAAGDDDPIDDGVATEALAKGDYRLAMNVPGAEASDSVAFMWNVYDPEAPYLPTAAQLVPQGEGFVIALDPAGPPAEAFYPVEGEDGATVEPGAPSVAAAYIFEVAPGSIDGDTSALIAMDPGVAIRQARGAMVFFTPVDLETVDGVRGVSAAMAPEGLTAGWHLFVDAIEVPLDTTLEMSETFET